MKERREMVPLKEITGVWREDRDREDVLFGLSFMEWAAVAYGKRTWLNVSRREFERKPFRIGESLCLLKGAGAVSAKMAQDMADGRGVLFVTVTELKPSLGGYRVEFVVERPS